FQVAIVRQLLPGKGKRCFTGWRLLWQTRIVADRLLAALVAAKVRDRVARAGVEPAAKAPLGGIVAGKIPPDADQHFPAKVLRVGLLEPKIAATPQENKAAVQRDKLLPAQSLAQGADERKPGDGCMGVGHPRLPPRRNGPEISVRIYPGTLRKS